MTTRKNGTIPCLDDVHTREACGRQVEVISPGYTMLGGKVLQGGRLQIACCRKGFFLQAPKSAGTVWATSRVSDSAY